MNSFVRIVLFCAFLFVFANGSAQILSGPLAKGCTFGIDVGYNSSELYGSFKDELNEGTATNYEPSKFKAVGKNAVDVDLNIFIKLSKIVYIKTGFGYTEHGGKFLNTRLTYPVDVTLDYVNVPLGVGINPVIFRRFSVALEGGFHYGLELSSEQEFVKGIGPKVHQNRYIPGYFFSGSILGSISSHWAIKASYRYSKALRPFHENETRYGKWDGLQLSSKATAFSVGVVYSIK